MYCRYYLNWGKENSRFHYEKFQGTLNLQLEYVDFQLDLCALPLALYTQIHPGTPTHTYATKLDSFGFCFICMLHS